MRPRCLEGRPHVWVFGWDGSRDNDACIWKCRVCGEIEEDD